MGKSKKELAQQIWRKQREKARRVRKAFAKIKRRKTNSG